MMEYPEGFELLVKLAKKSPSEKVEGKEIWNKFCKIVLMGKDRTEMEISFAANLLRKYLDYDYVKVKSEFGWHDDVEKFLIERLEKIRDEDSKRLISGLLRDLTYIASSIKEGMNFFEKRNLIEKIDELTKTREGTENLIKSIVEDGEIPGLGYTKTILWLQSTGRAKDFAPPTRHLKAFLNNDVGPYYQYYEDDAYFMKRAMDMKKDFPNTELVYIYNAIFLYRVFKSATPRGSKFSPKHLVKFMKNKKMSFEALRRSISNSEKRDAIIEEVCGSTGH